MTGESRWARLWPVARDFLRLGLVAFGGPAAHLALLEDEFVSRRGWLSRQRFLDLMGATNLIPGPNSTEMAMHLGRERAGSLGLLAAGLGFIFPAAALTALLAWLYVEFGTLPTAGLLLAGARPAALVLIVGAVVKLGRKALAKAHLAVIAAGTFLAVGLGVGEVPALLGGGALGVLWSRLSRPATAGALFCAFGYPLEAWAASLDGAQLGKLGLFFLKIGAILYGSGYVLFAFLEGGLVEDYGWLTRQQLLDAIAVGQLTPGPILTAATFIGFLLAGPVGAVVATAGIFLPAFGFVWCLTPIVSAMRKRPAAAAFLDAINASAVGLMAAVAIDLAVPTLASWTFWAIGVGSGLALFVARWPAIWVIAGGSLLGLLLGLAGWH